MESVKSVNKPPYLYFLSDPSADTVISGFQRGAVATFALLGRYAA